MYTPARVWSQQNQDSKFRMGVLHILAGHSGPETAADGRTHFGIFATQVWKLFPRAHDIHLNFWDYNDVASGYFAAAEIAARDPKGRGSSALKWRARTFRWRTAASSPILTSKRRRRGSLRNPGLYARQTAARIRNIAGIEFNRQFDQDAAARLEEAGINVKVISAISEDLFDHQTEAYRHSVLPPEAYYDAMVVSTGTRRVWPVRDLGPLTDGYSLTSDWDNQWLTGGLEAEVIAEAHLDPESIFAGIRRFADEREKRISTQRERLNAG